MDEERATILRQHSVEAFVLLSCVKSGTITTTEAMAQGVLNVHKSLSEDRNSWNAVFDSGLTVGGNGLRVPLNGKRDRAKEVECKLPPEGHPKILVGAWALQVQTKKAVLIATKSDNDWVRLGLWNCSDDTPLTAWQGPTRAEPLQSRNQRVRSESSDSRSSARRRQPRQVRARGESVRGWPRSMAFENGFMQSLFHIF